MLRIKNCRCCGSTNVTSWRRHAQLCAERPPTAPCLAAPHATPAVPAVPAVQYGVPIMEGDMDSEEDSEEFDSEGELTLA